MYAFNDNWLDRGTCTLCDKTYKITGITRHLQSCIPRNLGLPPVQIAPGATAGARKTRYMQLNIRDYGARDYWLHLGIRTDVTLGALDGFLRELWLECCGHLSAFRIQGRSYESSSWGFDDFGDASQGMDVAIGTVLPQKTRGDYTYDFGSSTELLIESTGLYSVPRSQANLDNIQIWARNIAPEFACDTCGKPATHLELDEEDMWEHHHYCDDHSPREEDLVYEILNSPRCGVCAYGQ